MIELGAVVALACIIIIIIRSAGNRETTKVQNEPYVRKIVFQNFLGQLKYSNNRTTRPKLSSQHSRSRGPTIDLKS